MITTALVIVMRVSVLLGAAALLAWFLRRGSAAARHLVWTAAVTASLIVPVLSLAGPRVEVALLPAVTFSPAPAGVRAIASPERGTERVRSAVPEPTAIERQPSAAVPEPVKLPLGSNLPRLAGWVWLTGFALVLFRFALGSARMRWIAQRSRRVEGGPWLRLAQRLAAIVGVNRRVTFLEGSTAAMPMTWGILRPRVLLPGAVNQWPVARQRVVLLHELAHVKRRDCLTQLLAQIACAIYWFNPLAWLAARRLQAERERACDDIVLAAGTRGSEYADHLLDIARAMRSSTLPTWAAVAMAHRSQLEGRLMAILDPDLPRRFPTRRYTAALVITIGLLALPIAVVTPVPQAAELTASSGVGESPVTPATGAAAVSQASAMPAPRPAPSPRRQLAPIVREALKDAVPDATRDLAREGVLSPVVEGALWAIGDAVAQAVGSGVPGGVRGGVKGGVEGGIRTQPGDRADADARSRRRGDPRAVAALVEALKDTDQEVRESAMQALATMRAPEALDAIRASLKDPNASVREQAAFALGQYRDKASVDSLAAALADSSANVREQAVFALGQIRDPKVAAPLAKALGDGDASVREQAAFALGQLRTPEAVEPLVAALRDQSPNVREQAAFALGQIRDRRAVDALIASLKDDNTNVREQAAFALGQLGDPRAIDALSAALKDSNVEVRRQAAFALGQIGK